METMPDGRLVIFFPTAGKTMEGEVLTMPADKVIQATETDMKAMKMALDSLGIGLSKLKKV